MREGRQQMRVGVHLPQYGRVAGPDAITRAATHAEELGFPDLWVSDHIVHPAAQTYPSPYLFDPLVTLTWAAAVTERIGLGTSVLVVPTHNPLELANSLASLDALSGGRLTIAVGVGWSEAEYAALGYDFHTRGRPARRGHRPVPRRLVRRPGQLPRDVHHLRRPARPPKPSRPIPIWIGGSSEPAYRRAAATGRRLPGGGPLRRSRPARWSSASAATTPRPSFPISLRTGWDPQGMEPGRIPRRAGRLHRGRASSTWCRHRGARSSTTGCGRWTSSPNWCSERATAGPGWWPSGGCQTPVG